MKKNDLCLSAQFFLAHVHLFNEMETSEKLASIDQASNNYWHLCIICDLNVFGRHVLCYVFFLIK